MKVLALIWADETAWDRLPRAEQEAWYARYRAFGADAGEKVVAGAELSPTRTATTVRVRGGDTVVTDGPFAETHEQLGGYYVLDVETVDEAAELAAKIPGASHGAVELRPAYEGEETS